MYESPTGPELSADEARRLDDTYFAADPFGYFTSRINALLLGLEAGQSDQDSDPVRATDLVEGEDQVGTSAQKRDTEVVKHVAKPDARRSDFDMMVGAAAAIYRSPTAQARKLQSAVDAFAVRHHAAESLLRLTYVLLRRRAGLGSPSVWADVEATPTTMKEVLAGIRAGFGEDDRWITFRDLVYPVEEVTDPEDEQVTSGITTFAEWFNFSMDLFSPKNRLDLSVAHNKFKHGLGVRVRDDYLVKVSTSGPLANGDIPLSSVTGSGAVTMFDQTVLQFVARPGRPKERMGLEATTLQLNPTALLAQAALIAHAYAAMFCIASHIHFRGRDLLEPAVSPAKYPGLLVGGPLPSHITSDKAFVGLRQPLTRRRDGGEPREAMLFYEDGTSQSMTFTGPPRSGRVVDG